VFAAAARPVNWRRNLVALWITNFTGILGVTAMIPFVAFFLARDLGVHRPSELALWTGGAAASSGLGQAIAGPVWGALGDRFGRKPLLLRAVLMGGAFMILTSLSRSPQELLLYRFAFGLLAGPIPIAMAIVATETPQVHVARSLGILNSATALAAGIGPALGAVIVGIVDVRYIFAVAGAGLLVSSVFVITMVAESPRRARARDAEAPSGRFRGALLGTVVFILVALGIASAVTTMVLPLVSLRFLELVPDRAAAVTGIAFAISGVMTAIAGAAFGSILSRLRYRGRRRVHPWPRGHRRCGVHDPATRLRRLRGLRLHAGPVAAGDLERDGGRGAEPASLHRLRDERKRGRPRLYGRPVAGRRRRRIHIDRHGIGVCGKPLRGPCRPARRPIA